MRWVPIARTCLDVVTISNQVCQPHKLQKESRILCKRTIKARHLIAPYMYKDWSLQQHPQHPLCAVYPHNIYTQKQDSSAKIRRLARKYQLKVLLTMTWSRKLLRFTVLKDAINLIDCKVIIYTRVVLHLNERKSDKDTFVRAYEYKSPWSRWKSFTVPCDTIDAEKRWLVAFTSVRHAVITQISRIQNGNSFW